MNGNRMLLDGWGLSPQALNALERLTAARGWFAGSGEGGWARWAGLALLLVVLAAAVAVLAVMVLRRLQSARERTEALEALAGEYALSERETYVAVAIAKLSRAKNAEAAFTVPVVFERGQAALMRSPRVTAMTEERRRTIAELVESIRRKLGLRESGGGGGAGATEPTLLQGDRLTVVHRGQSAALDVRVADSGPEEFVVAAGEAIDCRPGETWLVRYNKGGVLWEIDASVVTGEGERVRLARRGRPRFINRRRFPRVPTHKEARVARFPTWRSNMVPTEQEFVAARLTEIAGPGLRLEAPLEAKMGERLLLAVKLGNDKVLEGVGKVRRATRGEGPNFALVVELLGLTDEEIARLTQETNAAAQENLGVGEDEGAGAEPVAADPTPQEG